MKEEDSTSRRRETPADVMVRRAARQLVAPLNEQIGLLQSEAVKLEAMARRSRAPGKIDPALTDATVAAAPEPVRSHSRVSDSRKVLRLLEQRLREMLDGLDPGKGSS